MTQEALAQPEQKQEPNEFLLRGILASELKCWHRLTADEVQNLIHFIQNMGAKMAQPEQEPVASNCKHEWADDTKDKPAWRCIKCGSDYKKEQA